ALRLAEPSTKAFFDNVSSAIGKIVHWIINVAPFGIMGLVYTTVASNGLRIFHEYGAVITLLVCTIAVTALVVNPLL
ncbi:cation:dicarboxylase symporter family transporter, partial [Vibrio cholerae O1]|nr:cation:dicarboxylase symporter family transporter [Vibrio cholerae O1]